MTAIRIQTQETFIPIELGDLTLKFDISDESIKNFRKEHAKIIKELEEVSVNDNDDETIERVRKVIKYGFDLFFGDESFEKVYKISPSVIICMDYFRQMAEVIESELGKMGHNPTAQEKAQKYLANKKK